MMNSTTNTTRRSQGRATSVLRLWYSRCLMKAPQLYTTFRSWESQTYRTKSTCRTVEGQSRRVLIECKDFDISGDKVGLPIVRNFWAVLDDTRADEGFIITCNGFTDDAAKYAKAKGIKLVVLRIHEEKDWEGFIKTVVVRLLALAPANPTMTIHLPNEAEKQRFESAAITPSTERNPPRRPRFHGQEPRANSL
jgi:Restriction endonuclease